MNQTVINEVFPSLIPEIAKELNLTKDRVISIYDAMGGSDLDKWQYFCDGQNCDQCHPNDAGYSILASEVYSKIFMPARKDQKKVGKPLDDVNDE